MVIQIIFGWPFIILFVALATIAAWKNSRRLMTLALVFSVPNSFYLFGGNGWVQLVAIYIPMSLGAAALLISNKEYDIPKLLLMPIFAFYMHLAYVVIA